jgi:peptidoglycan/xylan/chitin deacetylase (PgdA/CDA1 family)
VSDVIVLCYHAISPTWEAQLSTTPECFERQVELLVERGYRGVRFSEAAAGGDGAHERVVAITFDDAYRSVLEIARPILERFGLPATVFVPTDDVSANRSLCWPGIDHWLDGPFASELAPMSWSELGSLAAAGWEIGSHSGSHPRLTQIDDDALADELTRSKAACEQHLGIPCRVLAYPYGDVDARVVAAAAQAGYEAAATLPQRLSSLGALEWPRVGVYRRDGDLRFRLKVSPTLRRLRRSAAWKLIGVTHRGPEA